MNELASRVTFRLPDVSLLHSISSKACSSDSVVNAGRFIHINVVGIVLDANRKVIQVWSRTYKGDWTIKTLEICSISVYFLKSPARGDRADLG